MIPPRSTVSKGGEQASFTRQKKAAQKFECEDGRASLLSLGYRAYEPLTLKIKPREGESRTYHGIWVVEIQRTIKLA